MPRLQLLVATMNLTDIIGLCDKMHIASDALIINQSDCVKYECLFYHGYKIECYTFAERGLSRSRNNALLRCTGEILCIADDDMVYTDTYREDIINEFQKHPEADALVFNVTALNDERSAYSEHLFVLGKGLFCLSMCLHFQGCPDILQPLLKSLRCHCLHVPSSQRKLYHQH